MKKVVLILGLLMTSSVMFTSCRDENRAADDIENAVDDAGDEIEDAADDVEDEF
jgi:hypothetical protein